MFVQAIALIALGGGLLLAGCRGAAPGTPTEPVEMIHTMVAGTLIAQLTQTASAVTPTPPPPTEAPSPTPTEEPTPEPSFTPSPTLAITPTPTPQPLFSDDFSSDANWHTEERDDFGFVIADGVYRIYVNLLNAAVWTMREINVDDVRLSVEAIRHSGAQDGYYGLICRFRDGENYYALVVAEDGYAAILKKEEGEFEELAAQTGVSAIQAGDGPNHLVATCAGETLSLEVNGQLVLTAQDDDYDSGDMGLTVGSRSGGLEVHFDDFALHRP